MLAQDRRSPPNGKPHRDRACSTTPRSRRTSSSRARRGARTKDEQDGRWLAFRATQQFPKDADDSRRRSARARRRPRARTRRKAAQTFAFRTYPPLRDRATPSAAGAASAGPGMPFTIVFNNPLDADRFDDAQIAVTPDDPGREDRRRAATRSRSCGPDDGAHDVQGRRLAAAWSTSSVRRSASDADADVQRRRSRCRRSSARRAWSSLDPAAKKPTLDFFTTNYEQLKVRLYQVTPADYDAFGNCTCATSGTTINPPKLPGKKVFDQLVKTDAAARTSSSRRTSISSPALDKAGLGHVIAIVEPYPWKESYEPPRMIAWVQSTQLGVDAHVDGDNLIAFATELGDRQAGGGRRARDRGRSASRPRPTTRASRRSRSARAAMQGRALPASRGAATTSRSSPTTAATGTSTAAGSSSRAADAARLVRDRRSQDVQAGRGGLAEGLAAHASIHGKGGDVGGHRRRRSARVDVQGHRLAAATRSRKGSAAVNAVGGFDTKFTLPKTPNLGYAYVQLRDAGPAASEQLHARLPDRGVPPARVRGHRAGEPGAVPRRWLRATSR